MSLVMKFSPNITLTLGWLLLFLVSLFSRSFVPIDETRYVTVAWNMFQSGQYMVPMLNDIAYSHKPPLLFWLINLGWHWFGVSDWWARMVPAIFGLGAMLLTRAIGVRLWPQHPQIGQRAALILLSTTIWAVFSTATMFDMMVAFFTSLAVYGLLVVTQDKRLLGWGVVVIALAGGLLAKGPTILLQVLPLALLMPWWFAERSPYLYWYRPLLLSILLSISLLLAWAIPAGILGGAQYQHEIFWGQTAERMVNSFAHQRPIYWYLMMLPVILFPWLWVFTSWRAWVQAVRDRTNMGVRLCLAWAIPVLLAFSLISGKQMHYLLPIFPALALLLAYGWQEHEDGWMDGALLGLLVLAAGLLVLNLPWLREHHRLPEWVMHIQPWVGWSLSLVALAYLFPLPNTLISLFSRTCLLGVLVFMIGMAGVVRATGDAYDMRGVSAYLAKLENAGVALGNVGDYHGQFNFVGRMHRSPQFLEEYQVNDWFAQHPSGRIVVYLDNFDLGGIQPEYSQLYRGIRLAVIDQSQWTQWTTQRVKRRHLSSSKEGNEE
jgi:hypothetical protein